ncbi:MAG: hypothetical protein ACK4NM_18880, partial [Hydrogenophaga sp.]
MFPLFVKDHLVLPYLVLTTLYAVLALPSEPALPASPPCDSVPRSRRGRMGHGRRWRPPTSWCDRVWLLHVIVRAAPRRTNPMPMAQLPPPA